MEKQGQWANTKKQASCLKVLLTMHESEKAPKTAMINRYILQSCVSFKLPKG